MYYSDKVGDVGSYVTWLSRQYTAGELAGRVVDMLSEGGYPPPTLVCNQLSYLPVFSLALWVAHLTKDSFCLDDADWIAHCTATTDPDGHGADSAESRNAGAAWIGGAL